MTAPERSSVQGGLGASAALWGYMAFGAELISTVLFRKDNTHLPSLRADLNVTDLSTHLNKLHKKPVKFLVCVRTYLAIEADSESNLLS